MKPLTNNQKNVLKIIYSLCHITRGKNAGEMKGFNNLEHLDWRTVRGLIERDLMKCSPVTGNVYGYGWALNAKGVEIAQGLK